MSFAEELLQPMQCFEDQCLGVHGWLSVTLTGAEQIRNKSQDLEPRGMSCCPVGHETCLVLTE